MSDEQSRLKMAKVIGEGRVAGLQSIEIADAVLREAIEPEMIARIAAVAAAVGFQSGVSATEIAGLIVSVLAAQPEQINRFMSEGTELFLDGTIRAEGGCLTYMAQNGSLLSAADLRSMKGLQQ